MVSAFRRGGEAGGNAQRTTTHIHIHTYVCNYIIWTYTYTPLLLSARHTLSLLKGVVGLPGLESYSATAPLRHPESERGSSRLHPGQTRPRVPKEPNTLELIKGI